MNYDATDAERPSGEVLLRGPCMFDGYYKQPDKTEEVRVYRRACAVRVCVGLTCVWCAGLCVNSTRTRRATVSASAQTSL